MEWRYYGFVGAVVEALMPVNLSIKNVPDALAQALRDRAARNKRSLQRELMCLLEESTPSAVVNTYKTSPQRPTATIQEIIELSRKLFPNGTESSVEFIRAARDVRRETR